jgi:hypothetical protein
MIYTINFLQNCLHCILQMRNTLTLGLGLGLGVHIIQKHVNVNSIFHLCLFLIGLIGFASVHSYYQVAMFPFLTLCQNYMSGAEGS